MDRTCESCGGPYQAKRSNARFCSERCKKRAQRGHVIDLGSRRDAGTDSGTLVGAVERELKDAKRLDTALGQSAVALARRVAAGKDTGSAVASLNREMRATLAEATRGAAAVASPLDGMRDELAARRRA